MYTYSCLSPTPDDRLSKQRLELDDRSQFMDYTLSRSQVGQNQHKNPQLMSLIWSHSHRMVYGIVSYTILYRFGSNRIRLDRAMGSTKLPGTYCNCNALNIDERASLLLGLRFVRIRFSARGGTRAEWTSTTANHLNC